MTRLRSIAAKHSSAILVAALFGIAFAAMTWRARPAHKVVRQNRAPSRIASARAPSRFLEQHSELVRDEETTAANYETGPDRTSRYPKTSLDAARDRVAKSANDAAAERIANRIEVGNPYVAERPKVDRPSSSNLPQVLKSLPTNETPSHGQAIAPPLVAPKMEYNPYLREPATPVEGESPAESPAPELSVEPSPSTPSESTGEIPFVAARQPTLEESAPNTDPESRPSETPPPSGEDELPAPSLDASESLPAETNPIPSGHRHRRGLPPPPTGWNQTPTDADSFPSEEGSPVLPGPSSNPLLPPAAGDIGGNHSPLGFPSALGTLPAWPTSPPGLRGVPSLPPPVWADKPTIGSHFPKPPPDSHCAAVVIESQEGDFSPDPFIDAPYDECEQALPYYGKKDGPRAPPFWLFGRSFYDYGPYKPASTFLGRSNLLLPQFMGYGDVRVGMASNRDTVNDFNTVAATVNLDMDFRLTSTERLHAFVTPLARNGSFTREEFNSNDARFFNNTNFNLIAGYFEGDLGAIVGGATNQVLPFDLPFAVGGMPMVIQNGVWMEDIIMGAAVTIPARNSPLLAISNMDVTFFTGWDGITSPAFQGDNSAASMYGVATWTEAWEGYLEADYAFLDDRSAFDRSYHNIGIGWTRRYGKWLSNSVRWIGNVGQDTTGIDRTSHGSIVLIENSLITRQPSNWIPYFNMWGGFGRPQSLARAGTAGGILRNTGILFESDNLTGYPTLDPSGQNTYGAALGLNIIKLDFSQQLVLETAVLQTMGGVNSRLAQSQQYGVGARYQINISNASLIRADAMYGFLPDGPRDISGARIEWRRKF